MAHMLWSHCALTAIHSIWAARQRRLDGKAVTVDAIAAVANAAAFSGLRNLKRLLVDDDSGGDDATQPRRKILVVYVQVLTDASPTSSLQPPTDPATTEHSSSFF